MFAFYLELLLSMDSKTLNDKNNLNPLAHALLKNRKKRKRYIVLSLFWFSLLLCSQQLTISFSGFHQSDQVHGMAVAPTSLLGMTTYLPPGQITALHPYVMHQQGIPPPLPSHVPQSHVGHFHSVPAVSSLQHWPNQQVIREFCSSSHCYFCLS